MAEYTDLFYSAKAGHTVQQVRPHWHPNTLPLLSMLAMFNSVFSLLQQGYSYGLKHFAVLVTFLIAVSEYKTETRKQIFIVAHGWGIFHYGREGIVRIMGVRVSHSWTVET